METLGKIFGSPTRVKIMRLFLFNDKSSFDIEEIQKKTLSRKDVLKKELHLLEKAGFLQKKKKIKREEKILKSGKLSKKKKQVVAWGLNKNSALREALKTLLIDSELVKEKELLKRIKKGGKLKLLILSGIFLKRDRAIVDMLIVMDKVDKKGIEKEIHKIESEIGKELSYALFDSDEFRYRIDMYDKLVRDVIDNEQRILFDKLPFLWK